MAQTAQLKKIKLIKEDSKYKENLQEASKYEQILLLIFSQIFFIDISCITELVF